MPPESVWKIAGSPGDYSRTSRGYSGVKPIVNSAGVKRKVQSTWRTALCDDGANGNLKPKSEYTAEHKVGRWKVAAVTPVCTAATRFFALDLLEDVAKQYRKTDRKRAQLVIAKYWQAATKAGAELMYDGKTVQTMTSWLDVIVRLATVVFVQVLLSSTHVHLLHWNTHWKGWR